MEVKLIFYIDPLLSKIPKITYSGEKIDLRFI